MQVNYIRIFLMGSGKGVRFRQVTVLGVRFRCPFYRGYIILISA
jgi:hypothetical protein